MKILIGFLILAMLSFSSVSSSSTYFGQIDESLNLKNLASIEADITTWQTKFFLSYFTKRPSFDLIKMLQKRAPAKLLPEFQRNL